MRKPKIKRIKSMRASVSIMLSVLMLPVYTFAGVVTDGARISAAKQMTAGALDLSANSALADYDDVLKSVYGLFAMSENEDELNENLSDYFIRTVDNTSLSQDDDDTKAYMDSIRSFFSNPSDMDFNNLINLNTECFECRFTDGAVLADPVVMKNQITEYMKYIGPLSIGSSFINKLDIFENFKKENEEMENKIERDKALDKIYKTCTEIYKNAYAYNTQAYLTCISDMPEDLADAEELCRCASEKFVLAKSEKFSGDDKVLQREKLINEGNELFRQASVIVSSWHDFSDRAVKYLEKAKSSLDELEKLVDTDKCDEENDLREIFDAVGNGEFSEYRGITESNINLSKEMRKYFSGINFCGKSVMAYDDYFAVYEKYFPENNFKNDDEAIEFADIFTYENYSYPSDELPEYCVKQGSKYAFYNSLEKLCGSSVNTADEKSAKQFLEKVKALGDFSKIYGADIPETDNILSVLSEEKLAQIKKLSAYADIKNSCTVNVSDSADSADMLEDQQNIMHMTSEFIGEIGSLAKKVAGEGLEDIYLAEYLTEMFSCYTCAKEYSDGKVKEIKPKTLSGIAISPENNVFYRSEAEYILWGSNDMHKNHIYTNSLLFGTRFTLNSIYAFTDKEIKASTLTAATAIAGWTGFGVPVVQTVLIMSLSLAESVNDVNELLEGKAVPVYKNASTWNMKPSGIMKMLGEDAAEEVTKKEKKDVSIDLSKEKDIELDVSKAEEKKKDAVSLTYKEYLKIFILLGTLSKSNENAMLSRAGILVHINMNKGMKETGMSREKAFDICTAHTMIDVRAEVSINTWFMGVFVPNYNMNIDGSTKYEYDFSNLGSKEKIISCRSVMSY